MEFLLVCLISSTIITLGNCQCEGSLTAVGYSVTWKKEPAEDEIQFTVSAITSVGTWLAVGLSETQSMPNSDVVIGSYNGNGDSFIEDRWAFARERPSYDTQQNIHNTSITFTDGEMTMMFIRDITSIDMDNDIDLNQCVYLLRAWGGVVTSFVSPAQFNKHVNNVVFSEQLCLQNCISIIPSSSTISSSSSTMAPSIDLTSSSTLVPSNVQLSSTMAPSDGFTSSSKLTPSIPTNSLTMAPATSSSSTQSSTTSSDTLVTRTTSISTSGINIPTNFPHEALSTGLIIAVSVGGGLLFSSIFLILVLLLIWKVCCNKVTAGYDVQDEHELKESTDPSHKNPDFSGPDYDAIRHIL